MKLSDKNVLISNNGLPYTTWEQIAIALDFGKRWDSDPLRGFFDFAAHPSRMQRRINSNNEEFGDCDDHAVYWAAALLLFNLADEVYIASVQGQHAGGNVGHAVCVFRKGDRWYYADYNRPYAIGSKWEYADNYMSRRTDGVAFASYMVRVLSSKPDGTLKLGKWEK